MRVEKFFKKRRQGPAEMDVERKMNLNRLFTAQDMTVGKPWKQITQFAVPMLIGNLAQQLYSTVDTIVVGKYVGDNALSAVGSASPILNLMLALFVGVATGAGIVVSQHYGAKNREALAQSIGNCITLAALASVITMVIGPLLTMPLLRLLKTPESILYWCRDYLVIFFLGAAGFTFYNILSGILRGLGDSLSALVFLIVATILNIFLDIWFVAGFHLGVAGVSLATIASQIISAICCYWRLIRMTDVFQLRREHLRLTKDCAMRIIQVGIPSGITQAIFSVSMLVVQTLTNSLGEMVIACNVIVMRVDGFAMMPNMTFGNAMSVYAGQNVGAGKLKRVEEGTKQGMLLAVGASAVITLLLVLFGHNLMRLFTQTGELIDLSARMLRILAAGYIAMAVSQVLGGVMRGAGDTVTPMWLSVISAVLLRLPLAYGLAALTRCEPYPNGRPEALFGSLLISWVLGAAMHFIAYRSGIWKKKIDFAQM